MPTEQFAVRTLAEDELDQFLHIDEIAFIGEPPSPELVEIDRGMLELDRTIGVFDGPQLVGGASIFTLEMAVPGGLAPLAGVTWVSVLPTHRRRGVLSSMMRHQVHGLHESGGEAITGLTASEPPIYGRFGYGPATKGLSLTIPRHQNALRLPEGTDEVSLRLVPTGETVELCEEIYARQVPKRSGTLVRTPAWSRAHVADIDQWRAGRSKRRTVLAERDGKAVGYTRYRTKSEFSAGSPTGRVGVNELVADDPAAYAALLRYLVNIDLTATTMLSGLAVDSPVVHLLMNLRAAEPQVDDELYLRLVDVDRALASRTYSTQFDLVIEVADVFCPWNDGRWRLSGDEKGAHCERTTAAPDLALGVRELGAAFLGGVTFTSLAAAGLIEERRSGALGEASRAFAVDLAPWLSYGF
jgi:predicted acetyltransferase